MYILLNPDKTVSNDVSGGIAVDLCTDRVDVATPGAEEDFASWLATIPATSSD